METAKQTPIIDDMHIAKMDGTNNINGIMLPASLTIETVEDIHNQLKAFDLSDICSFSLDASQVVHLTTPGAQLLLSLERSLKQSNGAIALLEATEGFIEIFKALGLGGKVEEWSRPANGSSAA